MPVTVTRQCVECMLCIVSQCLYAVMTSAQTPPMMQGSRCHQLQVSPVWYQLRTDSEGALALVGGHGHNSTWLSELRGPPTEQQGSGGQVPAVVPRVIVELTPQETMLLLGRPGPAIDRLVEECDTKVGWFTQNNG